MRTKKNQSPPLGVLSLDEVMSQRELKTSIPPSSVFIGAVSDLSLRNLRGILWLYLLGQVCQSTGQSYLPHIYVTQMFT